MTSSLNRKPTWTAFLGAAALLFAAGCTGTTSDAASASTGAGSGTSSKTPRIAPECELEDIAGGSVALSDTAGQVRLVDFWATWCAPCREEVPMLNELHETYASEGLRILAISDENAGTIREFVEEYDVAYQNLVGSPEIFEEYGALGLPTAFLIDGDGKIVDLYFGPKPRKSLESKIRKLLNLPPATS